MLNGEADRGSLVEMGLGSIDFYRFYC